MEEKLEQLRGTIEALIAPPFTVWEVFDLVKALGDVAREVAPAASPEDYKLLLMEAWAWADGEYKIIELADNAIKFPLVLAPAEIFDGPAIRFLVERVMIPSLADKLVTLE